MRHIWYVIMRGEDSPPSGLFNYFTFVHPHQSSYHNASASLSRVRVRHERQRRSNMNHHDILHYCIQSIATVTMLTVLWVQSHAGIGRDHDHSTTVPPKALSATPQVTTSDCLSYSLPWHKNCCNITIQQNQIVTSRASRAKNTSEYCAPRASRKSSNHASASHAEKLRLPQSSSLIARG